MFFALAALSPQLHAEGLTLAEAMRATLQNSEEARMMSEKETRLDAQKSEVLSAALPNVKLYANAGRGSQPFDPSAIGLRDTVTGKPYPVINQALNRYRYGVQVDQPIFAFGRVGQAYRVAGIVQHSQSESNRRSRQDLELQTLDAFYGAVTSQARVRVIEASIKRQGEVVGYLQSNFQMGAGQRSSVLLAVSALKSLEPERIRARTAADAARMTLNRLVGRSVEAPLEPDTTTVGFTTPNVDTSEAGMRAILERRPDLQAMSLQKESLRGYARFYRMQYLPTLGFQGQWGIMAYQLNDQLTDFNKNLEWQVGVGMQWPIFDGFGQSSKARQYDSDARSLELSERMNTSFARIELERALREAVATDTAYEASRQARDAAEDARQFLEQDFRAGKGRVADLLSAEEGVRNAELGLLGARYQRVRAQAALRVAVGMDLIEEGSK